MRSSSKFSRTFAGEHQLHIWNQANQFYIKLQLLKIIFLDWQYEFGPYNLGQFYSLKRQSHTLFLERLFKCFVEHPYADFPHFYLTSAARMRCQSFKQVCFSVNHITVFLDRKYDFEPATGNKCFYSNRIFLYLKILNHSLNPAWGQNYVSN
jgi:hypothetical protein